MTLYNYNRNVFQLLLGGGRIQVRRLDIDNLKAPNPKPQLSSITCLSFQHVRKNSNPSESRSLCSSNVWVPALIVLEDPGQGKSFLGGPWEAPGRLLGRWEVSGSFG